MINLSPIASIPDNKMFTQFQYLEGGKLAGLTTLHSGTFFLSLAKIYPSMLYFCFCFPLFIFKIIDRMCLNVKGNDSETIHKDTCFREEKERKMFEGVWNK